MYSELLTIGDEILIGQIVNTNAVWMARELNAIGVSVKQISSVSDDRAHIKKALDEALERADIVLITGGLGPTKDDITKNTLAEYFGVGFRNEPSVTEFIRSSFAKRNIPFLPGHELQALVLENSELLFNHLGTAPGMWIEHRGKVIVSMPGVPYEMKGIMSRYVLPRLQAQFNLPHILHQTLVTVGLPESSISDQLSDFESKLPAHIKLAYLPHFGMVRLRLSGKGPDRHLLEQEVEEQLRKILHTLDPKYIAATDDLKPEQIVGELLRERQLTLSTAESCTGGYIAHLITSIAGSSDYFQGSVVSYSNEMKKSQLGVKTETLDIYGAVSEACVIEMAEGVRKLLKTDFAISTSGIAGPGGGSEEKPVGLVWIAVAGPSGTVTRKLMANGDRLTVIERTGVNALDMLRRAILGIPAGA